MLFSNHHGTCLIHGIGLLNCTVETLAMVWVSMAANVQQAQLRGSYQQIIDQDRGRLIDAFENDDADYIAVANTLGIKHSTSRSIVANYLRTGRCGKLAKRSYEKRQGTRWCEEART